MFGELSSKSVRYIEIQRRRNEQAIYESKRILWDFFGVDLIGLSDIESRAEVD